MFLRERGQLTLQERGALIALHQEEVSVREIADRLECHPTTVKRWIKRYEDTLDVNRRFGSGRPKKTTPAEDQMLLDVLRTKPITTAQEIAGKTIRILHFFHLLIRFTNFIDVAGIPISRHTVYRRLSQAGLRARVAAHKDFLTDNHKRMRLQFARAYADKDDEWWKSVIFSDEKTFGCDFFYT